MAWNEQAETQLYECMNASLGQIMSYESQWDLDTLQKKISKYLRQGAKVTSSKMSWQQVATDFSQKFFESVWSAIGEREWLDYVDWTFIVGLGIKAYCEVPDLTGVSDEEYMQQISQVTEATFDGCRYYSWSVQVLKDVVSGKTTQKRVREAIDKAREAVRSQCQQSPQDFVSAWIHTTVAELKKAGGPRSCPTEDLPAATAVQLFSAMCEKGGGIPLALLVTPGGLDAVWGEIQNSVGQAYAEYVGVGQECGMSADWSGFGKMSAMKGGGSFGPY